MKESPAKQNEQPGRKAYESPRVIDHGDVRDVTLGGSPGVGDSTNPTLTQPPT